MRAASRWIPLVSLILLTGCWSGDHEVTDHAESDESWAVTAWGDRFEIFAETDPLEVGATSVAFTHVTILDGFAAMTEGEVALILVDDAGRERPFVQSEATRAGIFSIEVVPEAVGEFDLLFEVETGEVTERIAAGRVAVGEADSPQGLIETAPASVQAEEAGDGEISFLKEQQWRTGFATDWTRSGSVSESVRGPGRVRPAAGGEVLLTSPVDAVVTGDPWPFLGEAIGRGDEVFRLTPRVASGRSLAELESNVVGLEAELAAAKTRLERLEKLIELGATSRRELEEARALEATLESRLDASRRDLATTQAGRVGGVAPSETVAVSAPFGGRIARVDATPGQAVSAQSPLALLVRESPLWVSIALRPEAAAGMSEPEGLDLWLGGDRSSLAFRGNELRLVSISPAVDPRTGTLTALFEVASDVGVLPIGTPVEAEILLAGERNGIVVPAEAVVDDGGVPIVYLQIDGESFARVEIEVVARQTGKILIVGVPPGARLVERGGNAIRRAMLVAQDAGEGHVH